MDSIVQFWFQMTENPLLFIAVTLTLGVILVNGWTDAPNAIATCVVTRCMSPRAAILMAAAAKDIAGKVWAIFFPILAFVIGGFEHCVANMFYIPAGLMAAQNPAYTELAESAYGISAEAVGSVNILSLLGSFVPVTIGNILGGALCVGTLCYIIYRKKD